MYLTWFTLDEIGNFQNNHSTMTHSHVVIDPSTPLHLHDDSHKTLQRLHSIAAAQF